MCDCVGSELRLERGEILEEQRCQVTIFTKGKQVLLMESINVRLCVVLDDAVGDNDWATLVRGSDSVQRETARKTSDRSEQALESLGEMVRDVIFVHLGQVSQWRSTCTVLSLT